MFSLPTFKLPKLFSMENTEYPSIDIPSVEIHDVETAADKRPRTLKHLLKANHANHSIIYHNLQFHNHVPHVLGSAYMLGATPEHMNAIYDKEAEDLEAWKDSPGEISQDDWRDFVAKRNYQRAFVDFFEDQLVLKKYDWKLLLEDYMFKGKEPLINGVIAGLSHPLIHLGYAYELDSKTVAIEALVLGACFYSSLHKYIDDPSYTKPSPHQSISLLEILEKVRNDKRLDGLFDQRSEDTSRVFGEREDVFLEYWNAWDLSDPQAQFEESQKTAVAVFMGTEPPAESRFDFFFVHVVTSSHAIRVLLPLVPSKFHLSLMRQWWMFTLAVYITQLRPEISLDRINGYDLKNRDWKFVQQAALGSKHRLDAHFLKALRAMKVAGETWQDETQFYLKAAVKFAEEFGNWGGFSANDVVIAYPQYH